MTSEIIASLISSIIGGLLVALVNFVLARKKNQAETDKFLAETDKFLAETEKIRVEMEKISNSISSANSERTVYDGTLGIAGYDITETVGCSVKEGALIFNKLDGGFVLCKYLDRSRVKEFLPRNELVEGARKLRVSCEVKVTEGSCDLVFLFKPHSTPGVLEIRYIPIDETEWKTTDLYFRVPADKDCVLRVYLEPKSEKGSLQLKNLFLAERAD